MSLSLICLNLSLTLLLSLPLSLCIPSPPASSLSFFLSVAPPPPLSQSLSLSTWTLRKDNVVTQGECGIPSRRGGFPPNTEPCWHTALRCSVSRMVRIHISLGWTTQFVRFCSGSPGQWIWQVFSRWSRLNYILLFLFALFPHQSLITALHSGAQNTDSVAIDCSHYFGLLDAGMCLDPWCWISGMGAGVKGRDSCMLNFVSQLCPPGPGFAGRRFLQIFITSVHIPGLHFSSLPLCLSVRNIRQVSQRSGLEGI